MSWLTDLAGKAENLLNKIDQNAAVVLKDKNILNEQLQDVIWKTATPKRTQNSECANRISPAFSNSSSQYVPRTAPSGAPSPAQRSSPSCSDITFIKRNNEDDILRLLNNSEDALHDVDDFRGSPSGASIPSAGSSSPVNALESRSGNHSRNHSQGGFSSMSSSFTSTNHDDSSFQQTFKPVESLESYGRGDEANHSALQELLAENNLLKNEIRSLNSELSLLLQRSKAAEKEVRVAGQELHSLRDLVSKNEHLENQVLVLKNQLNLNEKEMISLSEENTRLKESSKESASCSSPIAKELAANSERLKHLQVEHDTLSQETNDLRLQVSRLQAAVADAVQQNERYRQQLSDVTCEAEQYRARATRVLQEKEKLLASLQSATGDDGVFTSSAANQEVEQLREELQLARQESASHLKLLQSARNDLQECEIHLEEQRQKSETEIERLQKKLQEERSLKLAVEADWKIHTEELESAKTQLDIQCKHLCNSLKVKDAELSQLKMQAQTSSISSQNLHGSAELESRVRNLATALMQKQGALEAMIAERNSLRLKLEKVGESKGAAASSLNASSFAGGTVLNVNENENVSRLRVPTLLSESPGDTGVTRRVKRAYSSLDTLGIRVGVFLRRYPLARILVILYMVLLHLWVALVLFSYSPEGHSSNGMILSPPASIPDEPQGMR